MLSIVYRAIYCNEYKTSALITNLMVTDHLKHPEFLILFIDILIVNLGELIA